MEIAADHLQKDRFQHTHHVIITRVTPINVHKLNCKKKFRAVRPANQEKYAQEDSNPQPPGP